MKVKSASDKKVRLSNEQVEQRYINNIKQIKRIMKDKICFYKPLEFKTAYKEFNKRIQDGEFKVIKDNPGDFDFETYMRGLIKNFMIEQTYFKLEEENFFQKIISNISKRYNIHPSLHEDILAFVREKMEKDKLGKVKKFKEKSKITTFLFLVTRNLIFNFLSGRKKMEKAITVYPHDIVNMLHDIKNDPEEVHITLEEEELKQIIAKKIEDLPAEEKVAFKLFYCENITNICEIARVIKTSSYKAKKLVRESFGKILYEVKSEIK